MHLGTRADERWLFAQLEGLAYLVWMYRNGVNCILGDEYVSLL